MILAMVAMVVGSGQETDPTRVWYLYNIQLPRCVMILPGLKKYIIPNIRKDRTLEKCDKANLHIVIYN